MNFPDFAFTNPFTASGFVPNKDGAVAEFTVESMGPYRSVSGKEGAIALLHYEETERSYTMFLPRIVPLNLGQRVVFTRLNRHDVRVEIKFPPPPALPSRVSVEHELPGTGLTSLTAHVSLCYVYHGDTRAWQLVECDGHRL